MTSEQAGWAASYRALPDIFAAAANGVADATLRRRPAFGQWSAIEVLGHMVDKLDAWRTRVERVATENEPVLVGYDQDLSVLRHGYQQASLEPLLERLRAGSERFARTVEELPDDVLDRRGIHTESGLLTLRACVEAPLEAAVAHFDQLQVALSSSAWSTTRLRIEQAGAPVLARPSRELSLAELESATVQRLIDEMFTTLEGTGVGLAAPQIGLDLRLVVIEDPARAQALVPPALLAEQGRVPVEPHVLVNPRLVVEDPTPAEFFEGCLSVEGFRAIVPRARAVRVQALDRAGQPFERSATGWYARILQHEVDHLDGRLYLERMLPRTFVSAASAAQLWTRLPIAEAKAALSVEPTPVELAR